MSQQSRQQVDRVKLRRRRPPVTRLLGFVVLALALLVPGSALVRAQTDQLAIGSVAWVANTDGEPLNLRAGPSPDETVVARLDPDEAVTVIAAAQVVGTTRWIPVKTANGVLGWVADAYLVATVVAAPAPSPTADVAQAELPPPLPSPEPMTASSLSTVQSAQQAVPGGPLDVEVKVKYPEAKGRHQEVTIWVTRNGAPVQDATVTMTIPEDEDQEVMILDPTNEEGRTYREFTFGRTKGTVTVMFTAESPDGSKGQAEASYFVR
jgi:hypothetical protein